jgi:hypothetical protein
MLHRFEIPDGDVPGIVDLDHVTGESCTIHNDIRSVKDDVFLVIDTNKAVIAGIGNSVSSGIENDPGIACDVQVIFDVHVGLGGEHRA